MSVVCAKIYENKIEIAADSIRISAGTVVGMHGGSKLFQENGMTIGGCGKSAETALMRSYIKSHKPENSSEMDILRFVVEFAKWKGDYCNDKGVENNYLMIYDGKLFFLEGLSVREIKDFYAIGAGMDFAFAALHLGHTPREAVKVACDLSCLVSEPIIEFVSVL